MTEQKPGDLTQATQVIEFFHANLNASWEAVFTYFAGLQTRNPELVKVILPLIFTAISTDSAETTGDAKPKYITAGQLSFAKQFIPDALNILGEQLEKYDIKRIKVPVNPIISIGARPAVFTLMKSNGITFPETLEGFYDASNISLTARPAVTLELKKFAQVIQNIAKYDVSGQAIFAGLIIETMIAKKKEYISKALQDILSVTFGQNNFSELVKLLNAWATEGTNAAYQKYPAPKRP